MSKRKRPPVLDALGKFRSAGRWSDENLKDLHDLTMLTLLHVQYAMHARGQCSEVVMIRVSDWGQLSPNPRRKAAA